MGILKGLLGAVILLGMSTIQGCDVNPRSPEGVLRKAALALRDYDYAKYRATLARNAQINFASVDAMRDLRERLAQYRSLSYRQETRTTSGAKVSRAVLSVWGRAAPVTTNAPGAAAAGIEEKILTAQIDCDDEMILTTYARAPIEEDDPRCHRDPDNGGALCPRGWKAPVGEGECLITQIDLSV